MEDARRARGGRARPEAAGEPAPPPVAGVVASLVLLAAARLALLNRRPPAVFAVALAAVVWDVAGGN